MTEQSQEIHMACMLAQAVNTYLDDESRHLSGGQMVTQQQTMSASSLKWGPTGRSEHHQKLQGAEKHSYSSST